MWLAKKPEVANATKVQELTLEEHLQQMRYYGKPRVSLMSDGWYSCVDMNTNTTGTSFEVKSDFNHATPTLAAKQCHERILNALKELTK